MPQRQPGIRVRCKQCGKLLHLKPELRGKKIRCPKCRNVISLKRSRPKRQKPSQDFIDLPESLDRDDFAEMENIAGNYSADEYEYLSEEMPPPPPRSVSGRSSRTRSRGRSLPPESLANARAIRKRYIRHEVGSIKMIGFLYVVNGSLFLLVAIFSPFFLKENGYSTAESFLMTIFAFFLGAGLLYTGIKIQSLEQWTRISVAILSGIGVLGFPLGTLVHGWILYLVFSATGSYIFSEEYQAVIAATPEIKYKSAFSFVVFGILIVVVLIFLSCLGIGLLVSFIES